MAAGYIHKGPNVRSVRHSNEDLTKNISHSVFVTNFPKSVTSRVLWEKCQVYGTVVDVFIPNKLTKAGKRFAFVRFIKVFNLDRLVANLCTLWIGSYHLFANHVRFDRPPKSSVPKSDFPPLNGANKAQGTMNNYKANVSAGSFVSVVNGVDNPLISPSPALVLDDGCINECDFSKCTMGRVKDLNSVANLKVVLAEEGFEDVTPFYLGGRWVMFECNTVKVKRNLMNHTGFCSWFHDILEVPQDFVSDERVVWVDIEGIPLYAWKRETFKKIGKKWGETVDIEDSSDSTFGRRVFMVRAKELFMWNPLFLDVKEKVYTSENDSVHEEKNKDSQFHSSEDEGRKRECIVVNESLGSSGGILCIWEESFFKKEYVTVSDHFVAIYGAKVDFFHKAWIKDKTKQRVCDKRSISEEMSDIDKILDTGGVSESLLCRRNSLKCQLHDIKALEAMDSMQKSKVKWAVEGDENTKFFHGFEIKRELCWMFWVFSNDGVWISDIRFLLSQDQVADMERVVSRDEIRLAVWDCGENKSPGPDGFTFEFFRKYWNCIGSDFVMRPLVVLGVWYKVVTKIMAKRLAMVINDIVSDTQSAFVANRHILDGPFILNEVLQWCKRKKKKSMFFKVDFAKAYDSVRWDFLIDVLEAFGFGSTWCKWVRGTFCHAKGSILVNGSPSSEFQFQCGLKQGDPLSPFLFILVMESLHLSVCRAVNDRLFTGIRLHDSISLSHLFYADDALFIGEWSDVNLRGIIQVLNCFRLASGLHINLNKSQLLGVGVQQHVVVDMANSIGCSVMQNKFRYLGVMVGECMSRSKPWDDVVAKLKARLSKWKAKTLSIGGRLTLLKSVLGASPLYNMSLFKVPKGVLKEMESIRNNFFKGANLSEKKITWVAWDKVLASKKKGGLGVASFYGLNRALCPMRILSGFELSKQYMNRGFDFLAKCSKRVGNGSNTQFWLDNWIGGNSFCQAFPRLFALETNRNISVEEKMAADVESSFRRHVRGGVEMVQLNDLVSILDTVLLSPYPDRWVYSLSTDGTFSVKDTRSSIDDMFLPSHNVPTRWVKGVPIKINVFFWKARRDCLPTRLNLFKRGVTLDSVLCPICSGSEEDVSHVFFQCPLAQVILKRICRWWEVVWQHCSSFSEWLSWFSDIRLSSKVKAILLNNSCLALIKLFVVRMSASWVMSRACNP
ncbi:RNA-directed DNA polymerase, eukaryota [Tanacetum coccineum]